MGKQTVGSESLVHENDHVESSRAEPEKFCLKKAVPSAKAKYS